MIKEFPNIMITMVIFACCIVLAATFSMKRKTYDTPKPFGFKYYEGSESAHMIALGKRGTNYLLRYSGDGVNWYDCEIDLPTADDSLIGAITYANGYWVLAVNSNDPVLYSYNGITWSADLNGRGDDGIMFPTSTIKTGEDNLLLFTQGATCLEYSPDHQRWVVGGRPKRLTQRQNTNIFASYGSEQRGLYFADYTPKEWHRTFLKADVNKLGFSNQNLLLNRPFEIDFNKAVTTDVLTNTEIVDVDDLITREMLGPKDLLYSKNHKKWLAVGQASSDCILMSTDGVIWRRGLYHNFDKEYEYLLGQAMSIIEDEKYFIAIGVFSFKTVTNEYTQHNTIYSKDGLHWNPPGVIFLSDHVKNLINRINKGVNNISTSKLTNSNFQYFPKQKIYFLQIRFIRTLTDNTSKTIVSSLQYDNNHLNFFTKTKFPNAFEENPLFLTKIKFSERLNKFYCIEQNSPNTQEAVIYTSTDGITWSVDRSPFHTTDGQSSQGIAIAIKN